jgi:uncharacterized membrane protein
MIPGITTKLSEGVIASAATIYPKTDLVRVTGTTTVSTIIPSFGGGFSGVLFLVPTDGNLVLSTAGNIMNGVTVPDEQLCVLVYSKAEGKWHAGAIS